MNKDNLNNVEKYCMKCIHFEHLGWCLKCKKFYVNGESCANLEDNYETVPYGCQPEHIKDYIIIEKGYKMDFSKKAKFKTVKEYNKEKCNGCLTEEVCDDCPEKNLNKENKHGMFRF